MASQVNATFHLVAHTLVVPFQKRVQNEPPMMFHRIGVTVLADRSDSEDCRSLVITTALGGVL